MSDMPQTNAPEAPAHSISSAQMLDMLLASFG